MLPLSSNTQKKQSSWRLSWKAIFTGLLLVTGAFYGSRSLVRDSRNEQNALELQPENNGLSGILPYNPSRFETPNVVTTQSGVASGRTPPLKNTPSKNSEQKPQPSAVKKALSRKERLPDKRRKFAPAEYLGGYPASQCSKVLVYGDYVYISYYHTSYYTLDGLNVTNPINPVDNYVIGFDYPFDDVAISGYYMFAVNSGIGYVYVLSLATPATPHAIAGIKLSEAVIKIFIQGNYLYELSGDGRLGIVNIATQSNPIAEGSVYSSYSSFTFLDITVAGHYAYVAVGTNGVLIFDVSNPSAPTQVKNTQLQPLTNVNVIAVSNGYLYASGLDNFVIYDISTPTNPVLVGSCSVLGNIQGITFSDNYVFLASGSYGIQRIDISDLANPVSTVLYNAPNINFNDIVVANGVAYVSDADYGMRMISIAPPVSSSSLSPPSSSADSSSSTGNSQSSSGSTSSSSAGNPQSSSGGDSSSSAGAVLDPSSTAPKIDPPGGSSGLSGGAKVGIGIAGTVGVIGLLGTGYRQCKKSQRTTTSSCDQIHARLFEYELAEKKEQELSKGTLKEQKTLGSSLRLDTEKAELLAVQNKIRTLKSEIERLINAADAKEINEWRDPMGKPLLHRLVEYVALFECLVSKSGVDMTVVDGGKNTIVHEAVFYYPKSKDVLWRLLNRLERVPHLLAKNDEGLTPLARCIRVGKMEAAAMIKEKLSRRDNSAIGVAKKRLDEEEKQLSDEKNILDEANRKLNGEPSNPIYIKEVEDSKKRWQVCQKDCQTRKEIHQWVSEVGARKLLLSAAQGNQSSFSPKNSPSVSELRIRVGLFEHSDQESAIQQVKDAKAKVTLGDHLAKVGLVIGTAYSEGDCFFDGISRQLESMNIPISPDEKQQNVPGHKKLRLLCNQQVKKLDKSKEYNWIKQAIEEDKQDYPTYLATVQYTAPEMEALKGKENLFSGVAIWGNQDIEGRIICQALSIQLHIIEIMTDNDGNIVLEHRLTDGGKSRQLNEKEANEIYGNPKVVHLAVYQGSLHFVPVMKPDMLVKEADQQHSSSFTHRPKEKVESVELKEMQYSPSTTPRAVSSSMSSAFLSWVGLGGFPPSDRPHRRSNEAVIRSSNSNQIPIVDIDDEQADLENGGRVNPIKLAAR